MDSSFNPGLNIYRSLVGTWQSFQGLGLLGGHGYVAQLPHALFLGILSFIFPASLLRYLFAFLMLLAGSGGSYFLTRSLIQRLSLSSNQWAVTTASLIAALVYILHLSTVQTFYVHLEPFIVMYGLFPWVLLVLFSLLDSPSIKKYLVFFVLNFGLSTIGFIPPIFISYALFVGLACATAMIFKPSWVLLKRSAAIVFLIAATNAYWLAGVGFFTFSQQQYYINSKLNQLTTSEFILKNESYGTLPNVVNTRSFYFDSLDQNRFESATPLAPILKPWMEHLNQPLVGGLAIGLFSTAVLGTILAGYFLGKQKDHRFSVIAMSFVTLAGLGTGIPILNQFSTILRMIPFLNQAFRIPFSKLSMSLSLFLAIGVGVFFYCLFVTITRKITSNRMVVFANGLILVTFLIGLFYYSLPSFTGNFLYQGTRVSMPPEYQELSEFFDQQPSTGRIANFPILTSTGWDMHEWERNHGYTGSGFYWYGIEQPILARAFDVWTPFNETYRNQMVNAIYAQDVHQFQQTLEKYDIQYLFIDRSIFVADNPDAPLYVSEIETLIQKLPEVKKLKDMGRLTVYEYQLAAPKIYVPSILNETNTSIPTISWDRQQEIIGPHISADEGYSFPFLSLAKEKSQGISLNETALEIVKQIDGQSQPLTFVIPDLKPSEKIDFNLFASKNDADDLVVIFQPVLPEFKVNDKTFLFNQPQGVTIPAVKTGDQYQISVNEQTFEVSQLDEQVLLGQIFVQFGELLSVSAVKISTPSAKASNPTSVVLSTDFWSRYQAFGLPLSPADSYQISAQIPLQSRVVDLQQTGFPEAYNCAYDQKGRADKRTEHEVVIYEAIDGGAACDSVSLPQLPMDVAYIIRVKGKNTMGLGPKFLVKSSASGRVVNEQVLPHGKFDELLMVTPTFPDAQGLSLHWETRSYGSEKSQNQFESIEIYTIPLSSLLGAHLKPTSSTPIKQTDRITTHASIGSGLHTLKTNFQNETWTVLSESYDSYWLGLDATNVLRPHLLHHSHYNDWANAWLLPSGDRTIVFIFVPQLLTWLGYGLLGMTFVILLLKIVASNKTP